MAHVDEVRWIPVPEVATRAAQVETGELDFADDLSLDQYDRLARSATARPLVAKPYFWLIAVFNKKEGLMTNQKLRQAWQAAVDIEPIMKAVAAGKPDFYRLDPSLMFQEVAEWHTKLAGLPYNERNVEKAKRLMKEAGYKGEPIRFIATKEYKWMYDFAVMMKQQMEDVGFVVDLQVVDWATLSTRRFNPKEYEVFTTGIGIGAQFDPMFQAILSCTWAGWTCDEEIAKNTQELAARDRPGEAARPLGAADAALVREGARRSAWGISTGFGRSRRRSRVSTRARSGLASTTCGSRSRSAGSKRTRGRKGANMRDDGGRVIARWPWRCPLSCCSAGPMPSPRSGVGCVRIANLGEPPTLDAHWTTATLTEVLTNHLYEGLYALDEGYRPIPMLAEALPAVSADGLTYTIRLRQGIKFHNGKEMT